MRFTLLGRRKIGRSSRGSGISDVQKSSKLSTAMAEARTMIFEFRPSLFARISLPTASFSCVAINYFITGNGKKKKRKNKKSEYLT